MPNSWYLVDPSGWVMMRYSTEVNYKDVIGDLKFLLKNSGVDHERDVDGPMARFSRTHQAARGCTYADHSVDWYVYGGPGLCAMGATYLR